MRADIVAGAVFPDYELTDHTGKRRKLSDLQGPDPMILVLSRGGYCPKDLRQAEGLVQLHHEMEVGYSRLVTICTDNMLTTNEYRDGVGAHWTFLSDPGRKVQKDLDIAEYTDPEHNPMNLVSLYSRSIMATGFLAGRPSKSFGKTCALC
jgi:peroxiredoxin